MDQLGNGEGLGELLRSTPDLSFNLVIGYIGKNKNTSIVDFNKMFLVSTGALGVTICVCLSVCPAQS